MKKIIVTVLILTPLLSGCFGEEEAEEKAAALTEVTQSVDWYLKNTEERIAKITVCNNNPGELSETPNCKNAKAAHRRNFSRKSDMDW